MRRLSAWLAGACLAVAPLGAAAGPDRPSTHRPPTTESTAPSFQGRLGVLVTELTPELRTHFGATAEAGVLVGRVEPGSPAAAAGVQVGDLIVAAGGASVADARDVIAAIDARPPRAPLALQVIRDGKPLTLSASITGTGPSGGWSGFWDLPRLLERWGDELPTPRCQT